MNTKTNTAVTQIGTPAVLSPTVIDAPVSAYGPTYQVPTVRVVDKAQAADEYGRMWNAAGAALVRGDLRAVDHILGAVGALMQLDRAERAAVTSQRSLAYRARVAQRRTFVARYAR